MVYNGYHTNDPELCVDDFTDWNTLENKICRRYYNNDPLTLYAHADDNTNAVRMLIIKNSTMPLTLYYCVNSKGYAVLPKCHDSEDEDAEDLNPTYELIIEKNTSVEFFMENLGRDDIVRTTNHAIRPDEISDEKLKKLLIDYFDRKC